MSDSTTLSVRLSAITKDRLAQLADSTRRSRSFLAAEAIASYVDRELAIVEAVERGRADIRAGRFTEHADVVKAGEAIIAAAEANL